MISLDIFTHKLEFLIFGIIVVYLWFRFKFTYWERKGVFGPKPVFPFGNIQNVIRRKKQFFEPYCEAYFKFKHLPYVGMYAFHRPVLCIHDKELMKQVMMNDFEHFCSHGCYSGGVGDPLAEHLFNIHGPPWRKLRAKISPTFTISKLKTFYPFVEKSANDALEYANKLFEAGEPMNMTEFYDKYSMDITGNVGFGVECNGFKIADSEFCLRGKEYFDPQSAYWTAMRALAFFAPDFFNALQLKRINPEITEFFYNLVEETVKYREKHNYRRNDFLQALIDLKNADEKNDTGETGDIPFTIKDLAANTLLYLFAGYETSATTGQFAAYELARNKDIQNKAREEVIRVIEKHGGECTYEAQNEMVYMNSVLEETLRKHPPLRALFRGCTKDYRMPDNVIIEKGTLVFIPIHSIQMDPDIFPEPDKFDPQRFSPENRVKIHPCHWMPFGEGPRKCLGLRQGYIQSKIALVKLLQKYELSLDSRTLQPVIIKPTSMVNAAQGAVWIRLRKLDNS